MGQEPHLYTDLISGSYVNYTAIAVGGTVCLEALVAGPICGASMNPIRSLAPAILANDFEHIWIYILAPILGAVLAGITWRIFK